ncbi:MAG: VOC family protein [Curvibacter sp.]|nr:VOC family protein [Curvibacter sp.]
MQPYLSFNGNCAEALAFYAECLGGQIVMKLSYGESPAAAQTPPDQKDLIMHARLQARGFTLMGSDMPPDRPFEAYKGFQLSVPVTDPEEGRRVFEALAQGGQVAMPFEATFWSPGFGMLTDRFGVTWMVNTESPAVAG